MPSRLTPNPPGLAEALRGQQMLARLGERMEQAKAYAEIIAPVRTGRYRYGRILVQHVNTGQHARRRRSRFRELPEGETGGGFHVEVGIRDGHAYARLYNDTPYARYLEFGTRYMRAQHIIGRAMDALRL